MRIFYGKKTFLTNVVWDVVLQKAYAAFSRINPKGSDIMDYKDSNTYTKTSFGKS